MTRNTKRISGSISAVLLCGLALSATAQEATPEEAAAELEPAVDVSATPQVAQRSANPAVQSATSAMDRLDLGTTSITGNQELPKVLYIVPWKRSDLGDLVGRPANTLLEEVLAPVDPEVFERQLGYYDTLHDEHREE